MIFVSDVKINKERKMKKILTIGGILAGITALILTFTLTRVDRLPIRTVWIPDGNFTEGVPDSVKIAWMDKILTADPKAQFVINSNTFIGWGITDSLNRVPRMLKLMDFAASRGSKVIVTATKSTKYVGGNLFGRKPEDIRRRTELVNTFYLNLPQNKQYRYSFNERANRNVTYSTNRDTIWVKLPKTKIEPPYIILNVDSMRENIYGRMEFDVFSDTSRHFRWDFVRFYVNSPDVQPAYWYTYPEICPLVIPKDPKNHNYSYPIPNGYHYKHNFLTLQYPNRNIYMRYNYNVSDKEDSVMITNFKFSEEPILDDVINGKLDTLQDLQQITSLNCTESAKSRFPDYPSGHWEQLNTYYHYVPNYYNDMYERKIENSLYKVWNIFNTHPAFGGIMREEDELRQGGYSYEATINGMPFNYYFGSQQAITSVIWTSNVLDSSQRYNFMYGDMFDYYANARPYTYNINPNSNGMRDNLSRFNTCLNLNDTPDSLARKNTIFIDWNWMKPYADSSLMFWSNSGFKWVLGIPAFSNDPFQRKDTLNKYYPDYQHAFTYLMGRNLNNNCLGIMIYGWDTWTEATDSTTTAEVIKILQLYASPKKTVRS